MADRIELPQEQVLSFLEGAYAPENQLPQLSEGAQSAVRQFFEEQGYTQLCSSVIFLDEVVPRVSLALRMHQAPSTFLRREGAVVGPTFLKDQYMPNGVSVWIPKPEAA